MVYGLVGRIAEKAIRTAGISLVKRGAQAFTRYDKSLFGRLYGKSGGRGVRHGRDIGAAIGGLMAASRGDDLDNGSSYEPGYSSRPKPQAYSRRGNKYGVSRAKYCAGYQSRSKSRSRRTYRN